ncbi:hypothetical protein H2509_02190 [Stappia sp. F7233]|uniref:Alpha-L-glutamate ligase-related protein ATP-grasp domain-containing protein n=1 Tax=Stappia albiluteola TaxID=2758565 RepID=A0A839AAG9_9HYPH|nr:sugar-transfer associated ATP-grasp domain-containing protein [Stappia albiluteola]MBA5775932.1 hypothetical protein [Stappia albiluteola]
MMNHHQSAPAPGNDPVQSAMRRRSLAKRLARYWRILSEDFPIYIRTRNKKSFAAQAAEIYTLYRLYGYLPYQYLKHGLYRKGFGREIFGYIPPELLHRTRDRANAAGDQRLVRDKLAFEERMASRGIRTARTLFILGRDGIVDRSGNAVPFEAFLRQAATHFLPKGLIVKPKDGGSGSAVFRVEIRDRALLHDGRPLDGQAFADLVFNTNNGHFWNDFLIQEAIVQHPELDRFNASSVNSVRIDTFIDDKGAVRLNAAVLKVGAPGSITDNASRGGYMIGIDLATGKLTGKARTDAKFGGTFHDLQERFGIDPKTFRLPHWPHLLETAKNAADAMRPFRALGWDVAISRGGPVVIETNDDYGVDVLQEMNGGYATRPLGEAYLDHYAKDKTAILAAIGKR